MSANGDLRQEINRAYLKRMRELPEGTGVAAKARKVAADVADIWDAVGVDRQVAARAFEADLGFPPHGAPAESPDGAWTPYGEQDWGHYRTYYARLNEVLDKAGEKYSDYDAHSLILSARRVFLAENDDDEEEEFEEAENPKEEGAAEEDIVAGGDAIRAEELRRLKEADSRTIFVKVRNDDLYYRPEVWHEHFRNDFALVLPMPKLELIKLVLLDKKYRDFVVQTVGRPSSKIRRLSESGFVAVVDNGSFNFQKDLDKPRDPRVLVVNGLPDWGEAGRRDLQRELRRERYFPHASRVFLRGNNLAAEVKFPSAALAEEAFEAAAGLKVRGVPVTVTYKKINFS